MSSSGLIYAVIVGAWAVYLVPMWLRREDELNRARQTQRYAAAIKVLSNKEAFERRWAKTAEATIELPLAVGQTTVTQTPARPKKRVAPAAPSRATTTARVAPKPTRTTKPTATAPAPTPAAPSSRTTKRVGLMARRRRVVTLLFGMSTLGALVTADLGTGYLWAMAMPAALLSVYIVRLRREERVHATEQARRRALADEARSRVQSKAQAAATAQARAQIEAEAEARAEAELDAYERRQAQAAARRRTAAARARAQSFTPQDSAGLRRASNG
jgi:hypothetical protein